MESIDYVRPLKPVAPWLGGKSKLVKEIVPLINELPHKTYVEVFSGMAAVFLARMKVPSCEVINDRSGEISNFFRILQRHYIQFMDVMKFSLSTRRAFDRLKATDPSTLTDLERAARFLYLQRLTYGANPKITSFNGFPGSPASFNLNKLAPALEELHERLSGVVIENLDWSQVLERYDRPETLFYLDPPYWGCEDDYGKKLFSRADFARMATALERLEGRFILSLNDTPGVRETFKAFHIRQVDMTYTIAAAGTKAVKEVLISNGPIEARQGDLLGA